MVEHALCRLLPIRRSAQRALYIGVRMCAALVDCLAALSATTNRAQPVRRFVRASFRATVRLTSGALLLAISALLFAMCESVTGGGDCDGTAISSTIPTHEKS